MSAAEVMDAGQAMARIGALRVVGPSRVEIAWIDGARAGRTDIVDLAPAFGIYKVYHPLRDNNDLFSSARIVDDGFGVAWEGADLEMSSDMIEAIAGETMTATDFRSFLQRNRLSQTAAAAALGRSRRQIGNYLAAGPIPRVVALACIGYEALASKSGDAGLRIARG